jgi:hypothetical protein
MNTRKSTDTVQTVTQADLVYAKVGGMSLLLDLYTPSGATSGLPTLLYLHGGGWAVGDKSDAAVERLMPIVASGFAVASVNYRLVPSVRYPAPVPRRDWTPSTSLPNTSPTPAGCQPGPERRPAANGLTGEPGWLTLRNHMLIWPALAPIRSLSCSPRLPCRPSSINRCGDRGTCELASWMAVSTPAGPTLTA